MQKKLKWGILNFNILAMSGLHAVCKLEGLYKKSCLHSQKTVRFKILNWSSSHSFSCCPTLKSSPPLMYNHTGTESHQSSRCEGEEARNKTQECSENPYMLCIEYLQNCSHPRHEPRGAPEFEHVGGFMSCVNTDIFFCRRKNMHWISIEEIFLF